VPLRAPILRTSNAENRTRECDKSILLPPNGGTSLRSGPLQNQDPWPRPSRTQHLSNTKKDVVGWDGGILTYGAYKSTSKLESLTADMVPVRRKMLSFRRQVWKTCFRVWSTERKLSQTLFFPFIKNVHQQKNSFQTRGGPASAASHAGGWPDRSNSSCTLSCATIDIRYTMRSMRSMRWAIPISVFLLLFNF